MKPDAMETPDAEPRGIPLEVGDRLPAVAVLNQDGEEIDLSKEAVTGWVLIYFYPKARTPGCTLQACSLRDSEQILRDLGVRVFGVSADSVESQKKFREKRRLPFTLLADPGRKLIRAFGVPTMFGLPSRMAFLFRDGRLVWRDLRASTWKQAEDVIGIVRGEAG